MINFLRGTLVERFPTRLVIDVNGIGYDVFVPLSTSEKVGGLEQSVTVLTHLHVREDILQLYGFATRAEKELFQKVITVSGIGPKVALGILSGCTVEAFCGFVARADVEHLKALPGVGKKTAERLILELKDKLGVLGGAEAAGIAKPSAGLQDEAILALVSLGYNRGNVEKIVNELVVEHAADDLETLIKLALRKL